MSDSSAALRELRELYYQRIRPVVGTLLQGRTVAVLDPGPLATLVDALARSGVLRWRVAPGRVVAPGSPLAVALGGRWVGQGEGESLLAQLEAHNGWEDRWDLRLCPDPAAAPGVELVLTASVAGVRRAIALGLPAVAPLVLRGGAATAALLCHPELPVPQPMLDALEQAALPAGDEAVAGPRRLDLLDACDLAAALARMLLLLGNARQPADLYERTLGRAAPLVLRGSPAWPWDVAFFPASGSAELARLLARPWPRVARPAALAAVLQARRVLLVGCGTASNWLPEILARFGPLCLVDDKPFSPFNPVRQLCGTARVAGGLPKPLALVEELAWRAGAAGEAEVRRRIRPAVLHPSLERPGSVEDYRALLADFAPDLAVVGTGRSTLGDDHLVARELRSRAVRHVVSTAFPGVTHYKHIVVDGDRGPSYADLQQRLPVDRGPGPTLGEEERQLFYGGTQPATLVETLPSVHGGLRLLEQLALPPALRDPWFSRLLAGQRCCLVGANRVEQRGGQPLYGVPHPFQVVSYGTSDIVEEEPWS